MSESALNHHYEGIIDTVSAHLKLVRRKRNAVTLLKIAVFAGMIACIVLLVSEKQLYPLWYLLGSIAAFSLLSNIDNRIVKQIGQMKERIRCCALELEYLRGELGGLDRGERYADPAHAYASDLDLFGDDSLFQAVNRTNFSGADDLLARLLLTPCTCRGEIVRRQEAARELAGKIDWTYDFRVAGALNRLSETEAATIENWKGKDGNLMSDKARIWVYLSNGISALVWIAVIAGGLPYQAGIAVFLLQLGVVAGCMAHTNRIYHRLNYFLKAAAKLVELIEPIARQEFSSEKMTALRGELFGPDNSIAAMRELQKIMNGFDQRNNILVAIFMNGFYMKELHHLMQLTRWCRRYNGCIDRWMGAVRQTDVLVSMANYRFNHPDYCTPEFSDGTLLDMREAVHPLLRAEKSVANDFRVEKLHELFIVTGANMAGKSTFLRMAGINLVLALSGNVAACRQMAFQPMQLFTSMRTTDNLARGTSYFHAELLRLKALTEAARHGGKLFIILDEMLKGTNSQDKLNGSRLFLKKLLSLPVSGIVATHDLELGQLAKEYPEHFRNVCFEIGHQGEEIVYDYKLNEGVSRNMNASVLLKQMGLV